jgi:hypothetical protein
MRQMFVVEACAVTNALNDCPVRAQPLIVVPASSSAISLPIHVMK